MSSRAKLASCIAAAWFALTVYSLHIAATVDPRFSMVAILSGVAAGCFASYACSNAQSEETDR